MANDAYLENVTEFVLYSLRDSLKDLEHINKVEPMRETSLCITRLEESIYWLDRAHCIAKVDDTNA